VIGQTELFIMNEGSVVMSFAVYYDFFGYKSGVYRKNSNEYAGRPAVKVIGWGHDESTGLDYWLCVNSWGTNWGENGLFKIAKGENNARCEEYGFSGIIYRCPDGFEVNFSGKCGKIVETTVEPPEPETTTTTNTNTTITTATPLIDNEIFYSHEVFLSNNIYFTKGPWYEWYEPFNSNLGEFDELIICQFGPPYICAERMLASHAFDGVTKLNLETEDYFSLPSRSQGYDNNLIANTKQDFDGSVNCVRIFGINMFGILDQRKSYFVEYEDVVVTLNGQTECTFYQNSNTDEPNHELVFHELEPMIFKCENQVQNVSLVKVSTHQSYKNIPGIMELQLGLCDWSSQTYATTTVETPVPEPTTTIVVDGDIFYSHEVFNSDEIYFTKGYWWEWYKRWSGQYPRDDSEFDFLEICRVDMSVWTLLTRPTCDSYMFASNAFDGVTEWNEQTGDFFALPTRSSIWWEDAPLDQSIDRDIIRRDEWGSPYPNYGYAFAFSIQGDNNLIAETKQDFDDSVNCVRIFGIDMSILMQRQRYFASYTDVVVTLNDQTECTFFDLTFPNYFSIAPIFKCENQVQRVSLVKVSSYQYGSYSDKLIPGIVELQLGLCDWSSRS